MGKISVYLDEELQVIRQHLDGDIDEKMALQLFEETGAAVARLRDPNQVRVLAVSDSIGKAGAKVRRMMLNNLFNDNVYRVALVGKNPFMRAAVSFFLVLKPSKKIRMFGNEDEALRWLNE